MQDAKTARSQQIGDNYRQLDTHLFQQTLDLTLEPYPVAYQLQLHPGQVAPDGLPPVSYKTQNEFLCNQPSHQPFRVLEIMLAPSRSTIRKRLPQRQAHMRLQLL